MKEYVVTWDIEVTANSPEEAAKQALEIQRDKTSTATVFKVWDDIDCHTVDLEEKRKEPAQ